MHLFKGFRWFAALVLTLPAWSQTISTIAGSGVCCVDNDGAAASAWLTGIAGMKSDKSGNLYFWDSQKNTVRKVTPAGAISTIAGNGTFGYSGDNGPALQAQLFAGGTYTGFAVDSSGNVYISDFQNNRIRKIVTNGIITTVAGTGNAGFSGDKGPAVNAQINEPYGLAIDSFDNLYIADWGNIRIRKVSTTGIITTFAGNGNLQTGTSTGGDGGQATSASFGEPTSITVDGAGNLYLTDGKRIRKVNSSGIISTVAGTGSFAYTGDNGLAVNAGIQAFGMATDAAGNLYFADNQHQRVRKIDTAGIITTVVGTGTFGFGGDGGPAAGATLKNPLDVTFDGAGNMYIADSGNGRIRKVSAGAAGTSILTSPAALAFSYTTGGTAPASQTLSLTSSGAVLNFAVTASTTSGSNWLAASPISGATPATLTVSISPVGLAAGTYGGSITITPSGAGNTPVTVAVVLNVSGAGAPTFTSSGVLNASGYQAKLAPDTVFVIFGSALGPAALAAAAGPDYPNSLAGTSITFTPSAGGTPVTARMIYTVAGQVAGLLPSSISPGTYAVRVTYNNIVSTPQNVTVVARSFGIATANSAGNGGAQATIGNVNGGVSLARFTSGTLSFSGLTWTLTPAHPGDTLVLWGTGGGADPANDSGGTSGDQTKAGNFVVNVGGRSIAPLYAGASSGYPGLWQINFTLPSDMAPDCFASVQVTAGGEASNAVTLPIAAAGQSACSDPQLSAAALANLDAGGHIVLGGFTLAKVTNTFTNTPAGSAPTSVTASQETASGAFARYSAAEWAYVRGIKSINGCYVNDRTAASSAHNPAAPDSYANAGASIPIAGPNLGASAALAPLSVAGISGVLYDMPMSNGTVAAGNYTITGKGGPDVGPFSATLTFPSSFTVAGWDSLNTIDRTQPLTLNWSGSGFDNVTLILATTVPVSGTPKDPSTYILHTVSLQCNVPASQGTYTMPTALLSLLDSATTDASAQRTANLAVEASNDPNKPNLTASGVDFGTWNYLLGVSKNLTVR